jgi:phospholipid-transporting ATPase
VEVTLEKGKSSLGKKVDWPSNRISTTKYEWYNFLPKNLVEQLHKFSTVYFLSISALQWVGQYTDLFIGTINYITTLGQQVLLMVLSAAISLRDDLQRRDADREINNTQAEKYVDGGGQKWVKVKWQEIKVGDVLRVNREEEFPADLVPLYSSGDRGAIYVSTANLDGETNLKTKGALPATQEALQKSPDSDLGGFGCVVHAEAPKASIHDFKGFMEVSAAGSSAEKLSLGPDQLLLRGTRLRNTDFIIGVVVYTGAYTRMVLNSRQAPMKQSNIEITTNRVMWIVLATQAFLALCSDVLYLANRSSLETHWYLLGTKIGLPIGIAYWFTFFVLYSNLMPMSLYMTVDMCNSAHAYFIKHDKKMCYIGKNHPHDSFAADVRASNLCQELGQVSYIFSDKTGTLTQNVMELKKVFIAGTNKAYGDGDLPLAAAKTGVPDIKLKDTMNFLEVLAVCHTVMVTEKEGALNYEAESPDDEALVEGAKELGWVLQARNGDKVTIGTEKGTSKKEEYTVVATNAFTSSRKRMSVIVQKGEEYVLLAKGADNVMAERLAQKGKDFSELQSTLTGFSKAGLRTLVLCRRQLRADDVRPWLEEYKAANADLGDREGELAKVADKIEQRLELCGATGIEDKLQDKVPETIENIREAGIKFWVLTGDKLETAKEIGFSANVLVKEWEQHGGIHEVERPRGDVQEQLQSVLDKCKDKKPDQLALLITGDALTEVLEKEELKTLLLSIAKAVSIVMACRVSPLQKAQMVSLVRENVLGPDGRAVVTLAIGDGANDVPMIQTAQVGVGIAGREGRQSVNNSDFAIGQFEYLGRLLFLHGRWNYLRTCKYTLFTFWRNAVQVLMITIYTFVSGYSGTILFEDSIRILFNFFGTVPIIATGIFDQDVDEKLALSCPHLYRVGREQVGLSILKIGWTLLSALTHSIILQLVWYFAFDSMAWLGVGDYYSFGTACFSGLLVDVFYRVVFLSYTHNKWTVLSLVVCLFGYVSYCVFLCVFPPTGSIPLLSSFLEPNMFQVPWQLAKTAPFWMCTVCASLFAGVFDTGIDFLLETTSKTQKEVQQDRKRALLRQQELGKAPGIKFSDTRSTFPFSICNASKTAIPASKKEEYQPLVTDEQKSSPPQDEAGDIAKFREETRSCIFRARDRQVGRKKSDECGHALEVEDKEGWDAYSRLPAPERPGMCRRHKAYLDLGLNLDPVSQQQCHSYISVDEFLTPDSRFMNMLFAVIAGIILVILGGVCLNQAADVQSVTVNYMGVGCPWASFSTACPDLDPIEEGQKKAITVDLSAMNDDILVAYVVGPFFQNHHDYLESEVIQELQGMKSFDALEAKRERKCVESTRRSGNTEIVPCGLKANSVFNDTFTFSIGGEPFTIQETPGEIAWESDINRYHLQEDYGPAGKEIQKLTDIYEANVIDPERGVKTPRFVTWMRPAALDHVINRLGWIRRGDIKGKDMSQVSVEINNVFPVQEWDGYKQLVFTEVNSMGGDEPMLGWLLIIFGVLSWIYGGILLFWIYYYFPRYTQDVGGRAPSQEAERQGP